MSSAFDRIAAARAPSRAAAPAAPRSYATFAPATNPLSPAAQSGGAANPYHDPAHGSPSSRLLRETLMTAHEAQETAAAAALELNQQGEQLRATRGVVRDVGEAAAGARALLLHAGRRALRSKLLLSLTIAAELAAIAIAVWYKYIRRR